MGRIRFEERHRVLREVYRHYLEFRDFFTRSGKDIITYGPVTISLLDLQYGLDELTPRKREAFFYNVILDMKQKDVAKIMGITTVSVGQYVDMACRQLAVRYFAEEHIEEEDGDA